MPETMPLQGKIALVTGASKGIGRATAAALSEAGAHVIVHYGRSAEEAKSLVTAIKAKGSPQTQQGRLRRDDLRRSNEAAR